MKALKWIGMQSVIMALSWVLAAIWMAVLFSLFEVEATLIWLAGAIAAAVLPLISFIESLLMLVIRKKNRMGFLDSLFTASVLVVGPFLGGYFYLIGECLECEPIIATLCFAVLVFALPTALVQSTLRKIFIKI
jgi:ABC-type multidrug transport system permease subunit